MSDVSAALFASTLRDRMLEKDVSFPMLSEQLSAAGTPVSIPTLRSWAKGTTLPAREATRRAVVTIEEVLEIDPGRLETLVSHAQWAQAVLPWDHIFPELTQGMRTVMADWDTRTLHGYSCHMVISNLDLDRPDPLVVHRLTFTATTDDVQTVHVAVDQIPHLGEGEDPESLTRVAIGARVVRQCSQPGVSLSILELRLAQTLAAGEAASIELHLPLADAAAAAHRFHAVSLRPALLVSASARLPRDLWHTLPGYETGSSRRRFGALTPQSRVERKGAVPVLQAAAVDVSDAIVWVDWGE